MGTKFIVYLRDITDHQGAEDLGVAGQRVRADEYIAAQGGTMLEEFLEAQSRRSKRRPQLTAALKVCQSTGATLVVAKLERLARDVNLIREIVASGIDVEFLDLPTTPRVVEGEGVLLVNLVDVAALEARLAGERKRAALKVSRARAAAEGVPWGHGAHVQARRALRHRRALYPLVLELRAQGVTTVRAVQKELNDRGVPAVRGGRWSLAMTHKLVREALTTS
jgi:DNA invertase Pin-like site-specific DNA recombinase